LAALDLRVRYFQDSTPADVPCREEHFIRREISMELPVEAAALVLVDMWNVHFIQSWIERAQLITRERILPALQAARRAGLHVVHAPCPEVACQYPQAEKAPPAHPSPAPPGPDWPPLAFRHRQGDWAAYAGPRGQPPGIGLHWDKLKGQLAMSPAVEVRPEDTVVATGAQLHRVLAGRSILHLVYAGFAANWCLLGRDYGIRAMARRGYHIVALRDCTAGVEFPDTLEKGWVTEVALREIEQQYGFSASSADFIASCSRVG